MPKYCQYIDQIHDSLIVMNNVLLQTLNLKFDCNNVLVSQDKWIPQRWEKLVWSVEGIGNNRKLKEVKRILRFVRPCIVV